MSLFAEAFKPQRAWSMLVPWWSMPSSLSSLWSSSDALQCRCIASYCVSNYMHWLSQFFEYFNSFLRDWSYFFCLTIMINDSIMDSSHLFLVLYDHMCLENVKMISFPLWKLTTVLEVKSQLWAVLFETEEPANLCWCPSGLLSVYEGSSVVQTGEKADRPLAPPFSMGPFCLLERKDLPYFRDNNLLCL